MIYSEDIEFVVLTDEREKLPVTSIAFFHKSLQTSPVILEQFHHVKKEDIFFTGGLQQPQPPLPQA